MFRKIHSQEIYKKIMKCKPQIKKGVSITSIAKKSGVPRSTISAWYHGRQPFFKILLDKLRKRHLKRDVYKNRKYKPRKSIRKQIPESAKVLTPEKAYILGVLCGDGYINYKDRYASLETITMGFIYKFQECFIKVYGQPFSGSIAPTCNGKQRVVICGKNMTEDIRRYLPQQGTFEWKVPEEIKASDEECKIAFLRGFFDSEGSVNLRFDLNMVSANEEGLLQIKRLLESIGIKCSEVKDKGSKGYRLYITGEENIIKFIYKIGTNIPSRLNKMKQLLIKYGLSRIPK